MNSPIFPRAAAPALLLAVVLAGCTKDDDNYHPIGRAATRSETEPPVYQIQDDDKQMMRASRRARTSVGKFITALRQPTSDQRDFAVKKKFVKDGAVEHLWLSDVKFTGNRFVGVVDNTPREISGLWAGTRVSVNPDEISDWSYVDKGVLVGGYTVRALLTELSPAERDKFLRRADFRLNP